MRESASGPDSVDDCQDVVVDHERDGHVDTQVAQASHRTLVETEHTRIQISS